MQQFTIQIPDSDIEYLNQRLTNARWMNPGISKQLGKWRTCGVSKNSSQLLAK